MRTWTWTKEYAVVLVAVLALAVSGAAHAATPTPGSGTGKHKHASRVQVAGVVNLNQATAAQLDLLPGVGAKAAQAILAYRSKKPFSRPEELVKVKGFGKKRYEKLKAHLAVQGPTTLKQVAMGPGRKAVAHPS